MRKRGVDCCARYGAHGAGTTGTSHKAPGEQPDYLSYLLRLWRVSDGEQPTRRVSLKSAHTGQQVGFSSLKEAFNSVLLQFLAE